MQFWLMKHGSVVQRAASGTCIDGTGTYFEVDEEDVVTFNASVDYSTLHLGEGADPRCVILHVTYNAAKLAVLVLDRNLTGRSHASSDKVTIKMEDVARYGWPSDGVKRVNQIELRWTVAELKENQKYGTSVGATTGGTQNVSAPKQGMKGNALGFEMSCQSKEAHTDTHKMVWHWMRDMRTEKVTLADDFTLVANKKKRYDGQRVEPERVPENAGSIRREREKKRKEREAAQEAQREKAQKAAQEALAAKEQEREAILRLLAEKDREVDEARQALRR